MSKVIKSFSKDELPGKIIGVKEIYIADNTDQNEQNSILEIEKQKFLTQFQHKGEEIIQNAELQAKSLREQIEQERSSWVQEKQLLVENAKKSGFEEGLLEGRNQGYEEYRSLINEANQMVESTKHEYVKHIEESEKVILDLGVVSAEKILQETIHSDPEKFIPLVRQAIKEVKENQEIKVIVHPSKYQMLLSRKDELDAILLGQTNCYIFGDEQLIENQCFIETENGRIDVSIDSQLQMLREKLFELLEGVHG